MKSELGLTRGSNSTRTGKRTVPLPVVNLVDTRKRVCQQHRPLVNVPLSRLSGGKFREAS